MLVLINNDELQKWFEERWGHDFVSKQIPPPKNATYEDGSPILNPINGSWEDINTGEVFKCEYAERPLHEIFKRQ
jgi:hypothetical protein